jgi:predicted kinase
MIKILVGISGSGKSTWASNYWLNNPENTVIVNRDKIRELLFGFTEGNISQYYKTEKLGMFEKEVTKYEDTIIQEALYSGKEVIIDATHLERKHIERYKIWNVETEVLFFEISLDEAVMRDSLRYRNVGEKIIAAQFSRFESLLDDLAGGDPLDLEPAVTIKNENHKEHCIIFDIDGTLAHKGDRNPFDWSKVADDTVDWATLSALQAYRALGFTIIICTGRDEICEDETRDWLIHHNIKFDKFFIRRHKDVRPDWVIKEEMWREISEDYYISGMFDDRLQVVRRARALGLKVFNVEYNTF